MLRPDVVGIANGLYGYTTTAMHNLSKPSPLPRSAIAFALRFRHRPTTTQETTSLAGTSAPFHSDEEINWILYIRVNRKNILQETCLFGRAKASTGHFILILVLKDRPSKRGRTAVSYIPDIIFEPPPPPPPPPPPYTNINVSPGARGNWGQKVQDSHLRKRAQHKKRLAEVYCT